MAVNGSRLRFLDPRFPDRGLDGCPQLVPLIAEAAVGFAFDETPDTDAGALAALSSCRIEEFEQGIDLALDVLVTSGRVRTKGRQRALFADGVGANLVDVFCDRFIARQPSYEASLSGGRKVGQRQVLCAMSLWLAELVIRAIRDGDAARAVTVMRDQIEVICEIRRCLDREAGSSVAARRARSRWSPMYRVRARAIELYQGRKWPSARKAAQTLAGELAEFASSLGWEMSADRRELTVYEWLLKARRGSSARQT